MPTPPLKRSFRPSLPTIPGSFYGSHPDSIKENIGHLFGYHKQKLPMYMYKDKPRLASARIQGRNWKRIGIIVVFMLVVAWFIGLIPSPSLPVGNSGLSSTEVKWRTRRNAVRDAFTTSWDYYAEHAWGMDVFHPVSQTSKNMGCAKRYKNVVCPPTGWIVVDALDTAMVMNLTSRVANAREWIATSLDFSKVDSELNTFETTIRVLGGLLSAHFLSTTYPNLAPLREDDVGQKGEDLYIEKATDLAERLMGAFNTHTGIPLPSCKLNSSEGRGSRLDAGAASVAEATSVQMEMKYVSKLTGEPIYWQVAEQVMAVVDAKRPEGNLMPFLISPESGEFSTEMIRLGARGDSYYECLIKQYLQTGSREKVYLDMWEESLEGIKDHLISWTETSDLTVLGERPHGLSQSFESKMDHLTCFLPGTIALGLTGGKTVAQAKADMGTAWGKKQDEDLILAEELMKTCWGMYLFTPTGLAPEIAYMNVSENARKWNRTDPNWTMPRSQSLSPDLRAPWRLDYEIRPDDRHNLQRPETIESLFQMWRITRDVKYREWGWRIFESFTRHTAVYDPTARNVVGYTSIPDVNQRHDAIALGVTATRGGRMGTRIKVGQEMEKDNMEGFWLSETLKYLYLLFDDEIAPWNDLEKVVITTEGHFLPRFDIGAEGKVWKTGWTRKERVLEQVT